VKESGFRVQLKYLEVEWHADRVIDMFPLILARALWTCGGGMLAARVFIAETFKFGKPSSL